MVSCKKKYPYRFHSCVLLFNFAELFLPDEEESDEGTNSTVCLFVHVFLIFEKIQCSVINKAL